MVEGKVGMSRLVGILLLGIAVKEIAVYNSQRRALAVRWSRSVNVLLVDLKTLMVVVMVVDSHNTQGWDSVYIQCTEYLGIHHDA